MTKIGIFGGSFDPVHKDHINICERFTRELGLDFTLIVPAACSPFKDGSGASGEHRFKMLQIATRTNQKLIPDRIEIDAEGKSYTCITAEKLAKRYPDAKLYLLMGTDSLLSFHKWKNPEDILRNCTPVVAGRKGENTAMAVKNFNKRYGFSPIIVHTDGDISSSAVREYLYLGLDASRFLPDGVMRYITENGLYKPDKYHEFMRTHSREQRLVHTVGVITTALKYARRTGADEKKTALAALLHDSAKYENVADYPGFSLPYDVPDSVVHQFLGAYVAEKTLGITDEEILGAIRWHTTGKPDMTLLEKIIYTADLLEPGRRFPGVDRLRAAVERDFDDGFKLCVSELNAFLKSSGKPLCDLSMQADEYYNARQE